MTNQPFISYAQNREDVMLWRALRHETPGFYIDAGAADPDLLSVTRAFYERGWRGIDIEPLPEKADRLRAVRPENVIIEAALSDRLGHATFHRVRSHDDTGLSTLDGALARASGGLVEDLQVELTTLADLCRAHVSGEVHFLKIDVEGAEAAVLRGADLNTIRPWIILVEATNRTTGAPNSDGWDGPLTDAGYRFIWFDGLNRFYLAAERYDALRGHFQVPPNPFDDYVVADVLAEQRLQDARALAEQRRDEVERLQGELARLRPPPPAPLTRPTSPLLYRVLRPMLHPLAEHLRKFLLAPVRSELAAMRAQQDEMSVQLDHLAAGPALDESVGRVLEAVLLTATLERDRSRR